MACLLPSQRMDVPQAVLDTIDPETASRYMVFPIAADRRTLQLAMADPTDLRAMDEVAFRAGYVAPVVAPELLVVCALERFYHVKYANRFLRFTPTLHALAGTLAEETRAEAAPRPGARAGAHGRHAAAADLVAAERNTSVSRSCSAACARTSRASRSSRSTTRPREPSARPAARSQPR